MLYQTLHDGIGARRIHASAMTLQDPMKIMLKLGVARKDGMILNAANVLFGKESFLLHPQCKIRLARFEGIDKEYFVIRLFAKETCLNSMMLLWISV